MTPSEPESDHKSSGSRNLRLKDVFGFGNKGVGVFGKFFFSLKKAKHPL